MVRRPSIVVVGSYAVGLTLRTDRFPVPGETRLGSDFDEGPGGKGSNQAIGIARLGARPRLAACVGDDRYGRDALALYDAEGVDSTNVRVIAGVNTGLGFIVVDSSGDNLIVLDPGANARLTPAALDAIVDGLAPGDIVLTQLEIPAATAARALARAREKGARTVLNPAPGRPLTDEMLASVDVLTPNESEIRILCGVTADADVDDVELARSLLDRGVAAVVLTKGAAGAVVVEPGAETIVRAPAVSLVDSTGAGDAFNAALTVALADGLNLLGATRNAVAAGALACTRRGVVPSLPTKRELALLVASMDGREVE